MHKVEDIPQLLSALQPVDGPAVDFNEPAITADYQKHYDNRSGIAIKILIVFGGFLASVAFVAFLFLLEIFKSDMAMLVLGIGFTVAALFINKVYDKLIVDTLSVSMFLIGLSLSGIGLSALHVEGNGLILFYALAALATLIFNRSYVFSFLAVLLFNGSVLAFIANNGVYDLVHVYIIATSVALAWWMLSEAEIIAARETVAGIFSPVRSGLIFSLLVALIAVGKRGLVEVETSLIWLSSVGSIGIILYLVKHVLVLLNKQHIKHKWLLYGACLVCLVPTAFSPAVAGSVLILLLSFMVNYRTGVGIALVALTYFIAQYYYDLNLTLLQKSGLLVLSGTMLLILYFVTAKMMGDEKI